MEKITDKIYRLTTSYKDIFTTVYVIMGPSGVIIFDSASFDHDVDESIVPELERLGISGDMVRYVVISHNHADHAGGLRRFMEVYPDTCIVTGSDALLSGFKDFKSVKANDGVLLEGGFRVVSVPGHTADSIALYEASTKTLITGDCLQQYGIFGSQDWGAAIYFPEEHLKAIPKIRAMDIELLLTAHDYHPYGYRADGHENVQKLLDACVAPLEFLKELMINNPDADDVKIREMYNASVDIPPINLRVAAAMRNYISSQ